MAGLIVVILKGYPRLSETFIAQELLGLEKAGHRLAIMSMRHPTDPEVHPMHACIRAPVSYLPEYLYREPLRVFRSLITASRTPGFKRALAAWLGDLLRDPTPNRVRRFGQALVLAAELPSGTRWLYAHFIHTPSSVARYTSLMTGLPWSCSAHAKDIWTSRGWELRTKIASARWITTCTAAGHAELVRHARSPDQIRLVYHGLDADRFPPNPTRPEARDGSDPTRPARLLTIGRAVEKKGFDLLLAAVAHLPRHLHWSLVHIGGGERLKKLRVLATRLGVGDRVRWAGPKSQREVLEAYRSADVFVLPCRVASSGDRDGLPNVLLEAQSQRLACLSTTVSAIPELICDGETGVLVPPENQAELARALERLITDPALRHAIATAAERRLRQRFGSGRGIAVLSDLFRASLADRLAHVDALETR